MCNQTVGLVAAAIEREGIPTVAISLLREITAVIRPPRSLLVPFPLGFPLGEPNNAALQHRVIAAALALLARHDAPILEAYQPGGHDPLSERTNPPYNQ
jgi:hypothetical protein